MEEIIKKAIEGGYTWEVRGNINKSEAVLDPLFWQALGKACGWESDTRFADMGSDGVMSEMMTLSGEWKDHALRFHEINLTEGWDSAISNLSGVIKN